MTTASGCAALIVLTAFSTLMVLRSTVPVEVIFKPRFVMAISVPFRPAWP